MPWLKHDSVMYFTPDGSKPIHTCKIAGLDLDSTLIISNAGEMYASRKDGWTWAYSNTAEYMKALKDDGWTIVVFSNRRGPPWSHTHSKSRMDAMMKLIGFEFHVYFAIKSDLYRKPQAGMVALFAHNNGVKEWAPGSFHCGDAAGPNAKNPRHRWSDADCGLAANAGIAFYEPQEVFKEFTPPTNVDGISLIITCGQKGSGWEPFTSYDGQTISSNGNSFFITSDPKLKVDGAITIVIGTHPARSQRDNVRNIQGATTSNSIVYWYAMPPIEKVMYDPNFVVNFQQPGADESTFRIN